MALSKKDFDAMEDLMRQVVKDETEDFVRKEDIKHLPTKDEFYEETTKILKKIQDLETEKTVLSEQVSRNTDRIEKVEKILHS